VGAVIAFGSAFKEHDGDGVNRPISFLNLKQFINIHISNK